jgi:hypothetical protein
MQYQARDEGRPRSRYLIPASDFANVVMDCDCPLLMKAGAQFKENCPAGNASACPSRRKGVAKIVSGLARSKLLQGS